MATKRCCQTIRKCASSLTHHQLQYTPRCHIQTLSHLDHSRFSYSQQSVIYKSHRNIQTKVKVKKKKKRSVKPIESDESAESLKSTDFNNINGTHQTPNESKHDIECTIQILEDTLSIIQYGAKKIFLIGTNHENLTSAQQVREVIEEVQPDTIVLEVCKTRAQHLWSEIKSYRNHIKNGGKINKYHKKQLLLGGEFRTALIEGKKCNASFVYADMDQHILAEKFKYGLQRAMHDPALSWNDRLKLRVGTVRWSHWLRMKWNKEGVINQHRNRVSSKERVDFVESKAPYLQSGIMHERNDLMAMRIRDCEGALVVAVVGLDHMEGIEQRFRDRFEGVDLSKYDGIDKEMVSHMGMERLGKLRLTDTWIGNDFAEFKHARDLPQKMI